MKSPSLVFLEPRDYRLKPCINRYSIFRRVIDYYNDDPTGRKAGEDAFDMRKPLSRDKRLKNIRKNGENFRVEPEDLYH